LGRPNFVASGHETPSRREWEAALAGLHEALGLRGRLPRYVAEIFIDVRRPFRLSFELTARPKSGEG